jgi:hypothetical protein
MTAPLTPTRRIPLVLQVTKWSAGAASREEFPKLVQTGPGSTRRVVIEGGGKASPPWVGGSLAEVSLRDRRRCLEWLSMS